MCKYTNNDPHIIAQYYLDNTVKAINGISYEISYNINYYIVRSS